MAWTYRQNGKQQVDDEVDKLDTPYTQSNAWPTKEEMAVNLVKFQAQWERSARDRILWQKGLRPTQNGGIEQSQG